MTEPLLAVNGLTKQFGGFTALADISMHVMPGERLGLIGPNGSGKTTLLNVVSGRLAPLAGDVRFNGTPITGATPEAVCRAGIAGTFVATMVTPVHDSMTAHI
jgi:ABC-type branched-subunit amino acid transport system ATPase component